MKKYTKVEKIEINQFRGLKGVPIEFGNRITLICGKNGTSKSTILGILAQIFSFSTDYTENPIKRNNLKVYKTLLDKSYESVFSEHFRFSENYDLPGSMDVGIELYDGIEKKEKPNLKLKLYDSKDRSKSRPVLRGNNDRNVTNPVIYLSVNRLTPIVSRDYDLATDEYIEENKDLALELINKILLQSSTAIDTTSGTINSLAPHNSEYDFQSISVGEDNVGQIVRALLSFKKLKEEYKNYAGGILLIDEVDAGLFPAAQIEFFNVLKKFCKEYGIQVIMTSHSPTMIEEVFSQRDIKNYKINYLTNTFGKIEVMSDYNWRDIDADIHVRTKEVDEDLKLPKINIYCEDIEAREFLKVLIRKNKLRRLIDVSETSLGGEQMLRLSDEKVPEFCTKSVIVLDADKHIDDRKNFCVLPGEFPPDQLLYDYLRRLPEDSSFWDNKYRFTKPVFRKTCSNLLDNIGLLLDSKESLQSQIDHFRGSDSNKAGVVRDKFKKFFKDKDIQRLFNLSIKKNPFNYWKNDHIDDVNNFERQFIKSLKYCLVTGHKVPKDLVDDYFKD